jgi:hypothetical protein
LIERAIGKSDAVRHIRSGRYAGECVPRAEYDVLCEP